MQTISEMHYKETFMELTKLHEDSMKTITTSLPFSLSAT
jgi:hypothetical protein